MKHTIIIPHRNRWENVHRCAESIEHSAYLCGIDAYQIVVVNNGPILLSGDFTGIENRVLVHDNSRMPMFNKPLLQNLGIVYAENADVLSFLDADAIVGPHWMDNAKRLLEDPSLTKLCYRVRYLPIGIEPDWLRYDEYPLAKEGYGRPEHFAFCEGPIFGNSQFSIRREVLGETRFNTEYVGRGHEDLWMNRELWMRDPAAYRAEIVTDAAHAMFHIVNPVGGPDWFDSGINNMNARRYRRSWRGMQHLLPIEKKGRPCHRKPPLP